MPDFFIELAGEQFKRTYLLYIIDICHTGDRYYYIGQTGDRNYITARPAFRRLAGHLDDTGKSTQNQIYRYIAVKILGLSRAGKNETFDEQTKYEVEEFLVNSTIRMSTYKVQPFDTSVSQSIHRENVKRVCSLETHVIKAFDDSGKCLVNKTSLNPIDPCPYPDLFERIKQEFELQ